MRTLFKNLSRNQASWTDLSLLWCYNKTNSWLSLQTIKTCLFSWNIAILFYTKVGMCASAESVFIKPIVSFQDTFRELLDWLLLLLSVYTTPKASRKRQDKPMFLLLLLEEFWIPFLTPEESSPPCYLLMNFAEMLLPESFNVFWWIQ